MILLVFVVIHEWIVPQCKVQIPVILRKVQESLQNLVVLSDCFIEFLSRNPPVTTDSKATSQVSNLSIYVHELQVRLQTCLCLRAVKFYGAWRNALLVVSSSEGSPILSCKNGSALSGPLFLSHGALERSCILRLRRRPWTW
jgi:hypothetical protein